MALTEERTLVAIEVVWANRILRDGQVISTTNHRGAYPLNTEGHPDSTVVDEKGRTLADIFGEALTLAQQELAQAMGINAQLLEQNKVLVELAQRQAAPLET